jgi:hypothetical protein
VQADGYAVEFFQQLAGCVGNTGSNVVVCVCYNMTARPLQAADGLCRLLSSKTCVLIILSFIQSVAAHTQSRVLKSAYSLSQLFINMSSCQQHLTRHAFDP